MASETRAALESQATAPDMRFLDMLTPSSRMFVKSLTRNGRFGELRSRLLSTLKVAKAGDSDGLVVGKDHSDSLFFARDGYGRRLDLTLSGATFANLRELEYPVPW